MVHYNVTMKHTEKTFERLAHMQYDLFCRSNLVARSLLSMAALVYGVLHLSSWWGVLLIVYGGYLGSGKYNSANHTAHKLARQIRDAGMDFPASRYVFRDNAMEIIPLPENAGGEPLPYGDICRLGEDGEYFYLFRDQYGGYMVPKDGLDADAFRLFMQEKTGQSFHAQAAPVVRLIRRFSGASARGPRRPS